MTREITVFIARFLIVIISIFYFSFCNSNHKESTEETLHNSFISTKWKLRYGMDDNVEYYIEFKDSLFINQFFQQEGRPPKMYPGEWKIVEDTLVINDGRGGFHLLIKELNDSVMILQKTDSIDLIFDIQPDGFYWE